MNGKSHGIAEERSRRTMKGAVVAPVAPERSVVPLRELYVHATPLDLFLLVIGALAAIAAGAVQPFMMVYFGEFFEEIGSTITSSEGEFSVASVQRMAIAMCVIGGIIWVSTMIYFSIAEVTAARQVA